MASLTYDLTLAGLSVGAAAALTGIGLIVTHRTTGVLNFAHGAIAMVCAYLLRQLAVGWGWPLWASAALVLLVVAPAIGLALERGVFRSLATSGNDPAQTLVASICVFVLLVGAAALLWGTGAREDAPVLVSADPWGQLGVAGALAVAVWAVTRWTRFGGELRAVVDNRPLAVLGGIDADRVAAAGWAFGAFTAGLTGVLLAPYVRLDPYGLPLLVMEVMAVAVAARLRLLSVAVVTALGIGVAQSQLTRVHPTGWAQPLLQAVGANLFVVALLVAALALPAIGGRAELPRAVTRRALPAPPGAWLVAAVLLLLPLGFAGSDLETSVKVPALAVVLLSLVVVTGRAGQLALGQAAFAGFGALFASLLAMGRFPGLPQLPPGDALLVSVFLVAPLGLLTAVPAIGRHGLALALATFAVGVGASRFVFAQPYAASVPAPGRPAGFGSDRAYYVLELLLLVVVLGVVALVRRGRAGRALAALRDHEAGAAAAGVPVPALKVTAFVVGAGIAALGGALLALGVRSFDPAAYDPVRGLLWFAVMVVLGADAPLGAVLGAALLVGLDSGTRGGVAAVVVGVSALLVGRIPLRARHRRHLTAQGTRARARLPRPASATGHGRLAHPAAPGGRGPEASWGGTGSAAEVGGVPQGAEAGQGPQAAGADGGSPEAAAAGEGAGAVRVGRGSEASGAGAPSEPVRANGAPESTETGGRPETARANRAPETTGTSGIPETAQANRAPETTGTDGRPETARANRAPETTGTDGIPETAQAGASPGIARAGDARAGDASKTPAGGTPGAVGTSGGAGEAAGAAEAARATRATRATEAAKTARAAETAKATETTRATKAAETTETAKATEAAKTARAAEATETAKPAKASGLFGGVRRRWAGGVRGVPVSRGCGITVGFEEHPVLRGCGITVGFEGHPVLRGVDITVAGGQVTAVVGPNGAGKSTLFHCLAGTLRPSAGQVLFGKRDITRLPAHARTRLGIARTFQELAVFPSLTVAENLRVGAEQGRVRDPDAARRMLRLFGLRGDQGTDGLPTGTLRRVELGRALAGRPHVLLLDEPAAGLDEAEVAALATLLRALADDGMALLVVEHDLDLVASIADTVHELTAPAPAPAPDAG
ncbi:ATP-binding cassette domain-containing protein [Streptomyces sp. VRA16 Mangrove soil]|uniref:ABC transporter permease subunit n=1 Tax=Streptomyces sp. VRA16 Mangrove soil TaxID=2817434 RepID=UPI001A9E5BD2|nr:ATP-binding cassette domain-containing protein [Streptomyces sp. VRA16 Mangrove soil]MBO1331996.1 ATP-binding cassette domain-containing protein [Streptomyces sp. VRA16 Mangrove soil]